MDTCEKCGQEVKPPPAEPIRIDWTREELIEICEKATVQQSQWLNRDSAEAQMKMGTAWALLWAGCDFRVIHEGNQTRSEKGMETDEKTIWIEITYEGFRQHDEGGPMDEETFYLPTPKRLAERAGGDWY